MNCEQVSAVVGLPDDPNLPFFAYGIFKPEEIAWARIENFVTSFKSSELADWHLLERNGLPIASRGDNHKLEGYLVDFRDGHLAYSLIGEVEPSGEYKWVNVVTEDGCHCNLLAGVKPRLGSGEELIVQWSSSHDPLFYFGMIFVGNAIRNIGPKLSENGPWGNSASDWDAFFELQGAYLTLWSIFERYAAFRYGAEFQPQSESGVSKRAPSNAKIHETARSQNFLTAINAAKIDLDFAVYSVRENRKKSVLLEGVLDPKKAVDAWYQVRNNLAHRGKAAWKENRLLITAAVDLHNTLFHFLGSEVLGLSDRWAASVQPISRSEVIGG